MGFNLRKSINIGGIRLNLSNSGIGFSTGVKGLRVGIDGKGRNYVGGGKGILRFRKYAGNNGKEIIVDDNYFTYNRSLKHTGAGFGLLLLFIIIIPVIMFFAAVLSLALFENGMIALASFSVCLLLPFLLLYFYCFPKFYRLYRKAEKLYYKGNMADAIRLYNEALKLEKTAQFYKFKPELVEYINAKIENSTN